MVSLKVIHCRYCGPHDIFKNYSPYFVFHMSVSKITPLTSCAADTGEIRFTVSAASHMLFPKIIC